MKQDLSSEDKAFKASTKICLETPSNSNIYQAQALHVAGYNLSELAQQCSITDMIFLMFTGELAKCAQDRELLKTLQVLLSIPSPRHPAARAAMNAGICKTNEEHLLPISLMALGGEQSGALEIKASIEFLQNNLANSPQELADTLINTYQGKHAHIAPGFGQLYGSSDQLSFDYLKQMLKLKPEGKVLQWVSSFTEQLNKHNHGILDVGLAASIFHELSFAARESVGLYQLFRAPGLLAYSMEQTHKPISAMPMLKDEQYELASKE